MNIHWQGELVRIRPFTSADELNGILEELSLEKDEFWGYGWWVKQSMKEGFEKHSQISDSIGWSIFAIDRLDTGELVGYEVIELPKQPRISAEVGTVILRKHWSCGFGREAKQLATAVLFENFAIERVSATTLETHSRARAGLVACGFALEGIWRRSAFSMGKWAGIALYGMYREQWETHPFRSVIKRGIVPPVKSKSDSKSCQRST